MQAELAERILTKTMDWKDAKQISQEIEDIQIMAEFKYDDYQQYTHGQRYIEKLSMWLKNFQNSEDRELAYKFIKENLVFISEEEMRQLVSVTFDMFMKPLLMRKTKQFCVDRNINDVTERRNVWKFFRRSALFLGLSDGAHIDYFRRHNAQLNNEQVFVHYDFSKEKSNDMLKKLKESADYASIKKKYLPSETEGFQTIFLLDDFSGSGKSYIRFDKDEKKWKGKIVTFVKQAEDMGFDMEKIDIHVVLYVATQKAIDEISNNIKKYQKQNPKKRIAVDIEAVQMVNKIEIFSDKELFDLLERDYKTMKEKLNREHKNDYVDEHYRKGDITYPFLGFDGCSLAIVLYHNTPNNTFPVIWFSAQGDSALFPRITRHKEE